MGFENMALYLSRYLKESLQVQYPKLDWQLSIEKSVIDGCQLKYEDEDEDEDEKDEDDYI